MKATLVDIYNQVMHKKTQELVSGEEAKKWASGRNVSDWSDGFDTAMQIAADIIACYYKDLANQKQFSMQEELAVRTAMDRVCCKIVEEQDALIMQTVSEVGFSEITIDRSKVVEAFTNYTARKPIEKFPFDLCPSCNTVVSEHNKFCSECGQKLDWRDLND